MQLASIKINSFSLKNAAVQHTLMHWFALFWAFTPNFIYWLFSKEWSDALSEGFPMWNTLLHAFAVLLAILTGVILILDSFKSIQHIVLTYVAMAIIILLLFARAISSINILVVMVMTGESLLFATVPALVYAHKAKSQKHN